MGGKNTKEEKEERKRRREGGESSPPQAPASSRITGAESPEELAQIAEEAEKLAALKGEKAPRGTSYSTIRKRQAMAEEYRQMQRQQEALLEMCAAVAPVPFEVAAVALQDARWIDRLTGERVKLLAQGYSKACEAWGFDFGGRITSLAMIGVLHMRVFGGIYAEIAAEDALKKAAEETERPN